MWTLLIALMLAAPPQASPPATESDRRADTYAVYSALMSSNSANRDAANPTYAIEATTFVPVVTLAPGFSLEGCVIPPPNYATSWAEILAEVKAGNIAPGILDPALKLSKPYMLLSANEVADFRSAFRGSLGLPARGNPKFGGAADLFRLSVVYFNKNRRLALMYNTSTCGMLCGEARWAVFEKLPLLDGESVWIRRPEWVRCVVNA